MTEGNKKLFQVILCHWIIAREEIKAGAFENDAKMILDEEGEAVNSPMGLMCLGFTAGMHHGLTLGAKIEGELSHRQSRAADREQTQKGGESMTVDQNTFEALADKVSAIYTSLKLLAKEARDADELRHSDPHPVELANYASFIGALSTQASEAVDDVTSIVNNLTD